jgi:hypothetical protein
MKTKDLIGIAGAAVGTAALTIVTFWSGSIEAGNEGGPAPAPIAQPTLVAHGVEVTLVSAAGALYKAGDEPSFELTAVNPGCDPATLRVGVVMSATLPESEVSRIPMAPRSLWRDIYALTLQPHEKTRIPISTFTKLPDKSFVTVSIGEAPPDTWTPPSDPGPVTQTQRGARAIVQKPSMQFVNSGVVALRFATGTPAAQPALAASKIQNPHS